MKQVQRRDVIFALISLCLGAVLLVLALLMQSIGDGIAETLLYAGSALCLGIFVFIQAVRLRCPHCGRRENLDRMLAAAKHPIYCMHCGGTIDLTRSKNTPAE